MSQTEVFVVSAVRTAIGSSGGSLKDLPLSERATTAVKAAVERAGIAADQVGHVVEPHRAMATTCQDAAHRPDAKPRHAQKLFLVRPVHVDRKMLPESQRPCELGIDVQRKHSVVACSRETAQRSSCSADCVR